MELSHLKTEDEYEAALKEVERLFELDNSTFDFEQMENLLHLIEAYEDKHYDIPEPNFITKMRWIRLVRVEKGSK